MLIDLLRVVRPTPLQATILKIVRFKLFSWTVHARIQKSMTKGLRGPLL